jgi:uncharacterized cupin superfamily protein
MSIVDPSTVPERSETAYPAPYRGAVAGRHFRRLGDATGITDFGVNLVRLEPGAASSQRHWHTQEEEFLYVLEGTPTLVTDSGETVLRPGMAAGFPKGEANGHHLLNRTGTAVLFLVVGGRSATDEVFYPDLDMQITGDEIRHKDGTPWET